MHSDHSGQSTALVTCNGTTTVLVLWAPGGEPEEGGGFRTRCARITRDDIPLSTSSRVDYQRTSTAITTTTTTTTCSGGGRPGDSY